MLPIVVLLALGSFIITLLSAIGKAPIWIAVLLLTIIVLLQAGYR